MTTEGAYEPEEGDIVRVGFTAEVTAYTANSVEVYSEQAGHVWLPLASVRVLQRAERSAP
ncbi:MAG: hypothetical protein JWO69_2034 [Thermoleophilia bacterium]|nr:hypothetical protein [Thermoleophilia bacterium]